jgi:hypothetical protein
MKLLIPIDISSVSLYLLVNDAARIDEIAFAPEVNLVFDAVELGVGGYAKKDSAPSAMVMLSAGIFDFYFFAEGVASWGSDRIFVRASDTDPFVSTYARKDELFFSCTAGFRYIIPDPEIEISCQYFFNGEGYPDSGVLRDALAADPALSEADLVDFGMHYAALRARWLRILGGPFGAALLWLGNCSDWSGLVYPHLLFAPFENLRFAGGAKIYYGDSQDEFIALYGRLRIVFEINAGSGMF